MLEFPDDSQLDAQLRETPLPERFLKRLHAALWTTDELLDEHLTGVAPPSTLLARLREIPDQEPVDEALCDVAVPSRLMSRLHATPVTPARRAMSAAHAARELATAAALLLAVTLGLTGGGYVWLSGAYSGLAKHAAAPQALYAGPLQVVVTNTQYQDLASDAATPTLQMTTDFEPPAPVEEMLVSLPYDEPAPELGPVGRWMAAQAGGLKPWENWVQMRWQLHAIKHDDRDDGVSLEEFPRAPAPGIEPPPARGYDRAFWLKHHVFPPMSTAVESLRSFAAPLTVDREGVARWEQLIAGGRKPAAKEVRVEEFAAAVIGTPPDLPPGKVSLITTGSPSPFGPPQSALLQLLAAAGPAATARPPRHTVVALDLSMSMGRRGTWSAGQRALAGLVDKLQPNDRLSLVVFREEVELTLEGVTADDTVEWRDTIRRLKPDGGADLAAGLRAAVSLAMNGALPTEMLVLTDHEAPLSAATRPGMTDLLRSAIAAGVRVRWFDLGAGAGGADDSHLARGVARLAGADVFHSDGVRGALAAWERKLAAPIASDVQAKIDFNPKVVAAYRLIGQEAGSWSRIETVPQPVDLRAGDVGQCLLELVFASPESDIGTVTLTWRDPASGQAQRSVRTLSRSTFASHFAGAPGHLQRACLAAEAAEVLRGSRDALRDVGWTGRETHDTAAVLAMAKNLSSFVREEPEFARLLSLLENSRRK